MTLHIGISFDYDSPAGYRESFHIQDMPPDSDQKGTEELLRVLSCHGIKATFGIVANAALEGRPPEFCPEQIRKIHSLGHEIASHSMSHRYLPSMSYQEMTREFRLSKDTLDKCIGAQIRGFIPPFNRPMHFPSKGAFSLEEMFGLNQRGRGRQSIETMLRGLHECNYGWSRVSFRSKVSQFMEYIKRKKSQEIMQPFIFNNIVAIPLHGVTGFGENAVQLVRTFLGKEKILTLYGHPNQALAKNDQSADCLNAFLKQFNKERAQSSLTIMTMGEIEKYVRLVSERKGHDG